MNNQETNEKFVVSDKRTERGNMDYISFFKENNILDNQFYTHDDIGISRLFYDLHSNIIRYVTEMKSWYYYDGQRWVKDDSNLNTMELCKSFVLTLSNYIENICAENETFLKYVENLKNRRKRENLLNDAKSINPVSISMFDNNKQLFNCKNGTLDLNNIIFREHRAEDFITQLANVEYDNNRRCPIWDRYINEIMCGIIENTLYLQKACGYPLSGETFLECFFILYGRETRNGKGTLCETLKNIYGDYAKAAQPQTISRRPADGAAPSPDIARLKGARFVNISEPEEGMKLNAALVKQLTGGDTVSARFLHGNPIEYRPEYKIFINTNHRPIVTDDSVFKSGRIKVIPFNKKFTVEEQNKNLKNLFLEEVNKSAILNWLIEGYRLLITEGLTTPPCVESAITEYHVESDELGVFLRENTVVKDGERIKTSRLFEKYNYWCKNYDYKIEYKASNIFVSELRKRKYIIERNGTRGNEVVGLAFIQD
jgi:putative DNA primase/helicase